MEAVHQVDQTITATEASRRVAYRDALARELEGYERAGDDKRAAEVREQLEIAESAVKDAGGKPLSGIAGVPEPAGIGAGQLPEQPGALGLDPQAPRRSDQSPEELAVQRAGVPPAGSETFETFRGDGPPHEPGQRSPVGVRAARQARTAEEASSSDEEAGDGREGETEGAETREGESEAETATQEPQGERVVGRRPRRR
jgi:hypothetical protein